MVEGDVAKCRMVVASSQIGNLLKEYLGRDDREKIESR